ncbi:hypothetical protein [Arthrobacter sp. IK3]|uniref:hypothetical protein n=1 Tax=Arthrobacter sp. IK3 TaxID=3448169 RepID=UPI003EDF47D2
MPHGRDDSDWEQLVHAGLIVLQGHAARRKDLTYTDFSRALSADTGLPAFVFPQDRQAIGTLLADISKRGLEDHPKLLLSALVISSTTKMPGGGFFDLARSTGLLSEGAGRDEQMIFFGRQLEGLHSEYSRPRARR